MLGSQIVEARMKQIETERDALLSDPTIKKYLNAVSGYVKENKQRDMTLHEQRVVAQCLRNAIDDATMRAGKGRTLSETTTEDAVEFLGVQLPVISALLPSLVLPEVGIVQAMDRRVAAVFYFDVKYGQDKGAVSSGDTMLSATTGHATSKSGRMYAMARVVDETIGTGNGNKTGTLAYAPGLINRENIKFESISGSTRTTLGTGDSSGNITGDYITGTGSVTAAGAFDVTFADLESGTTIYVTYDYQYDKPVDEYNNRDGVPEVDFTVTQSSLEAIDFPVRSRYSVGAALDMMKAHGVDLEQEVVKYLGHEIKFTIDQVGLDLINEAASGDDAADAPTTWDATLRSGEPWAWRKLELNDRFEEGNNNIFTKTKRAMANFIICGNDVARVIKQLGYGGGIEFGGFTPAPGLNKTVPTGPIKIGDLNGRTVIQNPFMSTNYYTMGYKGDNYLMAGFMYCPYIPSRKWWLYLVIDIENSVNCRDIRCISRYESLN